MPKANFKHLIFSLLSLTLVGVIGCSGPTEKKSSGLKAAEVLRADGKVEEALNTLENLATEFPNDSDILSQIGYIFTEQGDSTMAAFFLEQAHQQNPDDVELLYQTYSALEAANQPSKKLLEELANNAPDSMTPELWIQLGQDRSEQNLTQSALDAYLKGVDPDSQVPPADTAAAIGKLFIELDNTAQAERWFSIAAENDSTDALTALFGLLEIKLRQKEWGSAETIVQRLDSQFPGAIGASEWASAREELTRWRQAQEAMRAELGKAKTSKKAAADKAQAAKTAMVPMITSPDTSPTTANIEGKAQIIADMEAAESMATTPAIELANTPPTNKPLIATVDSSIAGSRSSITFNPEIAIEPAGPDFTFGVTSDQRGASTPTTNSLPSTPKTQTVAAAPVATTPPGPTAPIRSAPRPPSVDELIDDANAATIDKNYLLAISSYWQALGSDNDRDDIWNLLSRTYLIDGQFKNAETTALEAIRLSPRSIDYTLDYLRVAQRSKTPPEFIIELETAHDRFPQNPAVTLSLARGYERITQNDTLASILYRRFIDIDPNHPLRAEADAAISRLR